MLLLLTLLRLAWVLTHEMVPSEAYYWMCSQHPAGGYFDGPPGTAFVIRAFAGGFEMARLFWPVLGFFCSAAAWFFVRKIYDAAVAGWCVIFLNLLPVFNAAAVEVGPLMPALASVMAGLVFARTAWDGRRWAWVVAGLFFAAAVMFRYEAVLVAAGVLVGALFGHRHRKPADIFGLLVIGFLCILALLPALFWNASLEWIPIAGGTWKTAWEFRLVPFFESLAGFSRAFSVPVFLALVIGLGFLIRDVRRGRERGGFLLAACGAAWAWAFYLMLRGGDAVSAGFVGSVPLMAFGLFAIRKNPLTLPLGGFVAMVAAVASGWVLWTDSRLSWKDVSGEVQASVREVPAGEGEVFFIAEDTGMASVLGYYMGGEKGHPPVFVPESPDLSNQFGIWPSYADFLDSDRVADESFQEQKGINPYVGRNAIYVGRELPQTIKGAFQEVQLLRNVATPNAKDLNIYLCLGYQTLPL